MSLTVKVLIGLVAGLVFGALIPITASTTLATIAAALEPVGTIFINAIRMTVIPLVVATLVVGVASTPDARALGRIGSRSLVVFFTTLLAAAVLTSLVAPPVLALLSIDPEAAESMRQSAATSAGSIESSVQQLPTTAQWIVSLVPANPIRAAADGAMLPLIVFAILFGLALTRVEIVRRGSLVRGVQAIADASLVLVRWILELAPIGVFALAVPLATRLGFGAVTAIAFYIATVAGLCVVVMALLYVAVAAFGRVPLRDFAQAAAPAQAVGFSARSSLAALPMMIEEATTRLKVPAEISGFFIPLAASVFRVGSMIMMIVGVLFIAKLYGQTVSAPMMLTIAATSLLLTFSVPGVPGGTILVMVPVLLAANLPVQGIAILLGVDTIPDMFRTALNVTGHMTGATIIGRGALLPRGGFASAPVAQAPPIA